MFARHIAMVSSWGFEGRGSNPGTSGNLWPQIGTNFTKILFPAKIHKRLSRLILQNVRIKNYSQNLS